MVKKTLLILAIGSMISMEPTFAQVSQQVVNEIASALFSWTFSTVTNVQQIGQPIGNLVEYQISFQDPTWGKPVMYIDNIGFPIPNGPIIPYYMILPGMYNGSSDVPGYTGQLITNSAQLNVLERLSYPLGTSYDLFTGNKQINLKGYIVQGTPSTLFINTSNSYGVMNADIADNGVNSDNTETTLSGFFQTGTGYIDYNMLANYYSSYSSLIAQLYNLANNGNYGTFIEGNPHAPKTILVFGEPNCPYCNSFYTLTKPYVNSGQLQIHWSLISFINADSRGKVLAILMGDVPAGSHYPHTPAGAFAYNEDNFTQGSDDGGGISAILPNQASSAAITASNNADYFAHSRLDFYNLSLPTTPTILYQDTNGRYQIKLGVPQNIQAFINSIQSGDN